MDTPPEMSVIVAIQDGRGQEEKCIRRLAREQTLARGRYEIIVAAPGLDPGAEKRVAPLLGDGDGVVPCASENEFFMYNEVAKGALGRVLFFIEAHCVADPDCLERVLDFLGSSPGLAGTSCRSVPVAEGPFAEGEQELFESSLVWLKDPEHWYKVLIHGFAIEREVFAGVGGFDHRLGNFAEIALAAKLHERGHRIGYAEKAVVHHHYLGELRELFSYISDFTEGEMEFRSGPDPAYVANYVDPAPEWTDRRLLERSVARRRIAGAIRAWRELGPASAASQRAYLRRALRESLPPAWLGSRPSLWRARARLARRWLAARRTAGRGPRGFEAYREWWRATISYSRASYLHRHRRRLRDKAVPVVRRWSAGAGDDRALAGFHSLERWQGRPFCWSRPLAAIEVGVPPGPYRCHLELLPLRPRQDGRRALLMFDGSVIPRQSYELDAHSISFVVTEEMFEARSDRHWLTIACEPLPTGATDPDPRELGLPVATVTMEALSVERAEPTGSTARPPAPSGPRPSPRSQPEPVGASLRRATPGPGASTGPR